MSFPVMVGMILTVSPAGHVMARRTHRQRLRKRAAKGRTYKARQIQSGTSMLSHQPPGSRLLQSFVVGRRPDPISAAPNVAALNKPPVRDRARIDLGGHPDILRALELPVPR